MAVIIHSYAALRMEERGATLVEVLQTIKAGRASEAKFGRIRYGMTFLYGGFWQDQFFMHKHMGAYCVVERADIIVITVVVKYF
jgi:hypothetical protein